MKLKWNQVVTLAIMALQFFAVGNLVTSPEAIRWMLALAGFIKLAQVYIASTSNPDGTPASVAKVTTEVTSEVRKEEPAK